MTEFLNKSFPRGIGNFGAPIKVLDKLNLNRKPAKIAKIPPDGNCLFRAFFCAEEVRSLLFGKHAGVAVEGLRGWVADQIRCSNPALADNVSRNGWYEDDRLPSITANLLQKALPGLWIGLLTINGEHVTLSGIAEGDTPENADPTNAVILVREGVQEHFNLLVWGGVTEMYAKQAHDEATKAQKEAEEGEAATNALLAGYSAGEMAQMRALTQKFENARQEQEDAAFAARLQQELQEAESLRQRQEEESLREAERLQQELQEAESLRRRQEEESEREAMRFQQQEEERSGQDQATLDLIQRLRAG
jgi:hypothetical protein